MKIARVVDAHMHLWDLENIRYPWLMPPFSTDGPNGSVKAIAASYGLDNYFIDAQDVPVQKIIHIEAGAHPDDALKETRWLQALADETGYPHAFIAHAPLNDPKVETLLAAHSEHKNLRGIRQILNWHQNPALTYTSHNLLENPGFQRGFALLNKFDLLFDLQIYPGQMLQAYDLIKEHPGVSVVLNHMGMPIDKDRKEWQQGMATLSSLPNVSVKVSGFGFIDRQWNYAEMNSIVGQTIDWFGINRVMFASDFPTDKLFNSFALAFDSYAEMVSSFSSSERDALFAENAERIYRI